MPKYISVYMPFPPDIIFDSGESVYQLTWTTSAAFRMWHGVICVKPRNHLCTATFATNICVNTVRENIS